MLSIKNLRILLILNILTVICTAILVMYYDKNAWPLIVQADHINLESMTNFEASLFLTISSLVIITFTYSIIAIWIEHWTGKWVFLITIVLTEIATCLIKISASTGLTMCIGNLSMVLLGMVLAVTFIRTNVTS